MLVPKQRFFALLTEPGLRNICVKPALNHRKSSLFLFPNFLVKEVDLRDISNQQILSTVDPNSPLSPDSLVNLRWKCSRCGANWTARVAHRVKNFEYLSKAENKKNLLSSSFKTRYMLDVIKSTECPHCFLSQIVDFEKNNKIEKKKINTIVDEYPEIAAQWDLYRNDVAHFDTELISAGLLNSASRDLYTSTQDAPTRTTSSGQPVPVLSLHHITVDNPMKLWWNCSICKRPWKESPKSRILTRSACLFCPRCQEREAILKEAKEEDLNSSTLRLGDMSWLIVEAVGFRRVDFSLDKCKTDTSIEKKLVSIPCYSNQIIQWNCCYCQHTYAASVYSRAMQGKKCPCCFSGTIPNQSTSLAVQRPDVAREVSFMSDPSELSVFHSTKVTFVCRRCLTVYKQRVRDRCLPHGGCPNCTPLPSVDARRLTNVVITDRNKWGLSYKRFMEPPLGRHAYNARAVAATKSVLRAYRDDDLIN